jgi:hypothetical protein
VAEVFGLDTVTTSLEERLQHVEGNAVVILTSCLEDFGVLPVVGAKLLEVLTWVLIWAASLDAVLNVIILVDRSRRNTANETNPGDCEGIFIAHPFSKLDLQLRTERVEEELRSSSVIGFIVQVKLLLELF